MTPLCPALSKTPHVPGPANRDRCRSPPPGPPWSAQHRGEYLLKECLEDPLMKVRAMMRGGSSRWTVFINLAGNGRSGGVRDSRKLNVRGIKGRRLLVR